jgi:hypothetical protein
METRVAEILADDTVVLAAGANAGIQEGMEFIIYELGEETKDPETGDSLGHLEIVKGHVEVTHVQEKQSTARTRTQTVNRTRVVTPSSLLSPFMPREENYTVDVKTKLRVGKLDTQYERRLTVKKGDLARSV